MGAIWLWLVVAAIAATTTNFFIGTMLANGEIPSTEEAKKILLFSEYTAIAAFVAAIAVGIWAYFNRRK